MKKMPMCPMMAKMPMMPMMQSPMAYMPMTQPMDWCDMILDEDERDEEYFAGMYSENCNRMLPFVIIVVDRAEQKGDMIYERHPDRQMVDRMVEEAYNNMVKEMPDMADEMGDARQFGGRRQFGRDLIRLLLLRELLRRRRRRRRRRDFDHWDNDFDDFYFED